MNDVADELRVCEDCLAPKPLTQFRPISRDKPYRAKICNGCHALREKLRYWKSKRKDGSKRVQQMISAIVAERGQKDRKRVEFILRLAAGQFGGTVGMAEELARYHHEAPLGSFRRYRAMRLAIKLVSCSQPAPPPDYAALSDEELADLTVDHTERFIAANPEFAATVLRTLSWRVIPPGASDADEDGDGDE